jgi:DNA-binding NarL/FixJ family response regulator
MQQRNNITIVVVDDHRLIREMWMELFSTRDDIQVLGDSGTFDGAIELIKATRPDIVLLDINLPPASGLDAVPLIRKFTPGTKIIAVSMHTEAAYARKMIRSGAMGYVTKNSSHLEIFKAIEEVIAGRTYVCSEMKNILSDLSLEDNTGKPDIKSMSMREMEIIKLISEGLSSKEISARLFISLHTVNAHRQNILKKLKLKNTVSLINFINTNDLHY